ncbi:MAG: TadE/TadG family type IV pilus assembly protein [Bacillota bacterium]
MLRRLVRNRKGQATVEMAVVLPILLWLLLGLFDVARMANAYLTVQHAAREAVRAGIRGATDAEVEQTARDAAVSLESDRTTVTISPLQPRVTGTDLTVTVTYRYRFIAMFQYAGTEATLEGRMIGRVE